MDYTEADATPAEEWLSTLNSTCNRLQTQYLSLLQAASGVSEDRGSDPRAGGGRMALLSDPPPPPLAANVGLSDLTVQVASENLCAAAAQILTLTRTLRLSLLLMDKDTVEAEEQVQVEASMEKTKEALEKAVELEQEYLKRIQASLNNGSSG